MGLDNGVELRFSANKINGVLDGIKDVVPAYVYDLLDVDMNDCAIDVCYWRKYWTFRTRVLDYLDNKYNNTDEIFEYKLDSEDLKEIKNICIDFLTTGEVASTIWSRQEECEQFGRSIGRLEELIRLVEKIEELKLERMFDIVFYDSY